MLENICDTRAGFYPRAFQYMYMTQRHRIQSGHMMLVTAVTLNRKPFFADSAYARMAIDKLYDTQEVFPFFLYGFVFMPDHCHLLLKVPPHGSISKIMYRYKRAVVFNLTKSPVWQRGFHIHIPKNAKVALAYVHRNPVKAGLCVANKDYPWSSASGKWDVTDIPILSYKVRG